MSLPLDPLSAVVLWTNAEPTDIIVMTISPNMRIPLPRCKRHSALMYHRWHHRGDAVKEKELDFVQQMIAVDDIADACRRGILKVIEVHAPHPRRALCSYCVMEDRHGLHQR